MNQDIYSRITKIPSELMDVIYRHAFHDVHVKFYSIGPRKGVAIECHSCNELLIDICEERTPHGN